VSAHRSSFSREKSIYWPGEFLDVVNLLTGRDQQGAQIRKPLYSFNTGAIVFAASVGVKYQRRRDVGSDRREITTTTFATHRLDMYIYLIALLGSESPNANMLKVDNEDQIIREFERYAAGGLEYLRTEFHDSPRQSPDVILERLFRKDEEDLGGRTESIPILI
jgi:dnd system-associated protein 4